MLLLFSLVLIVAFAITVTALFHLKNLIAYLLSIYLLIFGNIALTGHIAHLVNLLNKQWFYLLIEILLLGIAFWFWIREGQPHLAFPFTSYKKEKFSFSTFWKNPDLTLLALLIVVMLCLQISLIFSVPPNNNDSLAMHVPRTLYWLQHGNYSPWETPRLVQIFYPVNAQLQMLWTVLFSKTWRFLGFPQFFSQLAAGLAVVGIAQTLNIKPPGQWFAGLVFLTYPIIVVQSTTTQNDLVIGALFGISVYFLFLFFGENRKLYLVISGMPIAFALGTKLTAVFLLPGLGIIAILAIINEKIKLKEFFCWGFSIIVTFLLCGSIIFFQNWKYFGNPLGASETVERATHATDSFQESTNQVVLSSTKFIYQFIDPSGLPSPFWRWGIRLKAQTAEKIFTWLNFDIEDPAYTVNNHPFDLERYVLLQEDEAVFGFIGFLALLPFTFIAFIIGIKNKNFLLVCPFVMFITFLLVESLLRPGWTPYQGRYFIPVALVTTPLLGFLTTKRWLRYTSVPILTIFGICIALNTMLYNPAKPLLDEPLDFFYEGKHDPFYDDIKHYDQIIWGATYYEKIGVQTRVHTSICETVDEIIPDDTTVGYITETGIFSSEYCLFGSNFTRTVIPLHPTEDYTSIEAIQDAKIDYLLVYKPSEHLYQLVNMFELAGYDNKKFAYIYFID